MACYKQRKPKRLDYRILSEIHLVSPYARNLLENMEVRYGGVELNDPTVVLLRIENTGKESIKQKDFVRGEAVEVLHEWNPPIQARVVGMSPDLPTDSWGEITHETKVIRLLPYPLNPGQYIVIQMPFERSPGEMTVKAHFADQASPMRELDANPSGERAPGRSHIQLCGTQKSQP